LVIFAKSTMETLNASGSRELDSIVQLNKVGNSMAPVPQAQGPPPVDASVASAPSPAPQATTRKSYGGAVEATLPDSQGTLSRIEQKRKEKEDAKDEDWDRRLFWIQDLWDLLGVEGVLKYDPNDRYRLRKQEKARREVEEEERRLAGQNRSWFSSGIFKGIDGTKDEEKDEEVDALDYQTILDLVAESTKGAFLEGSRSIPSLPMDPLDSAYRVNVHELTIIASRASHKPFYHRPCCGL